MPSDIDVFIYPDCQLLDASGPWQVFASANELAGQVLYRLRLLATAPGPVRTNGGMTLLASHALAARPAVTPRHLHRLFQRHYGLPPRVYRARFGAHRQQAAP